MRPRRPSRSPRRSSRRPPTARAAARSCAACWPSTPTPAPRRASRRPTTACCGCSSTARRPRPGRGRCSTRSRTRPERSQNEAEQLSLAQYITQNSTGGKTLTFGNLLSFPLEGRMFYVQPLYVQAASGSGSFPQNKVPSPRSTATTVAWGDTLGQAVSGLFGEGDRSRRAHRARGHGHARGHGRGAQLDRGPHRDPGRLPGRPGRAQGRRLRGLRHGPEAARRGDQEGPGHRSPARRGRGHADPVAERVGDAVAQPVDHGVTDRVTAAGPAGRPDLASAGSVTYARVIPSTGSSKP